MSEKNMQGRRIIFRLASCATCRYFNAEDKENNTCAAYPEGIPDNIISGIDRHDKLRGDEKNGLYYSKEVV